MNVRIRVDDVGTSQASAPTQQPAARDEPVPEPPRRSGKVFAAIVITILACAVIGLGVILGVRAGRVDRETTTTTPPVATTGVDTEAPGSASGSGAVPRPAPADTADTETGGGAPADEVVPDADAPPEGWVEVPNLVGDSGFTAAHDLLFADLRAESVARAARPGTLRGL